MKNYFKNSVVVPKDEELYECNEMMSTVDELAPSDSNVQAIVKKLSNGRYQAQIAIQSLCGKFQAEGETPSLVAALRQAQNGILNHLENWKISRFAV